MFSNAKLAQKHKSNINLLYENILRKVFFYFLLNCIIISKIGKKKINIIT